MTFEDALKHIDATDKKRSTPKHQEHELQVACVRWARLQYPKLIIFAIPNGSYCGFKQGRKLKAEGVIKGIPDLFVALARKGYNGLFIEMKAGKRGVVRDEQTEMMSRLMEERYCCAVCRDFEEFKKTLDDYILDITP